MPRVTINRKKYMLQDLYVWIKGKMSLKDMTQEDLGKILGISQESAFYRLDGMKRGNDTIKYKELITLFKAFDATDEEILKFMKL